ASNVAKDFSWLSDFSSGFACEVNDLSDQYGLLALQGPQSKDVLQKLSDFDLDSIERFRFVHERVAGSLVLCSRTGYTGEDGFELYCPVAEIEALARSLVAAGESADLQLVGLAARDSLRLEAGYALYGHEIDEEITPLQAGLSWTVKWTKPDFVGREALLTEKREGVQRKIRHFSLSGRRIAREGEVVRFNDDEVGRVVSGGFSPVLERPIGSALVCSQCPDAGLSVDLRGTQVFLEIKTPPLFKD
ncbi:MAG: glycine cleavage T C-terminal barrel domain-containing protein, partial [Opitutales bacterium]